MCTNNIWRPCFQFFGVYSQNVLFIINLIISKWLARQNAPVSAVFSLQYCSWQRWGCFSLARWLLWAQSAGASEGGARLEEEEGHRPLFYSLSTPCLLSVQRPLPLSSSPLCCSLEAEIEFILPFSCPKTSCLCCPRDSGHRKLVPSPQRSGPSPRNFPQEQRPKHPLIIAFFLKISSTGTSSKQLSW